MCISIASYDIVSVHLALAGHGRPTRQDLLRLRESLDPADSARLLAEWPQRVAAWRDHPLVPGLRF